MTDQTIPADKVRDIRDQYARLIEDAGTKEAQAYYGYVVKDLDALLPRPPHPTLADMAEEERDACRWMQADVANRSVRYVIANPFDEDNDAALIAPDGNIGWILPGYVTPRPDLPRMTWPGDKNPDTPDAVPPNTLAVGSEWGDIDALTQACEESGRDQIVVADCDGDVYVWEAGEGWWESGAPSDGYEPYTILHTGKEFGQ